MSVRVPSLNTITVSGRLTKDVDLKYIPNGKALAKFSIANTEYFNTNGEKKENTTFIDVTCWGKIGEWVSQNVNKGSAVLINGKLKSNSWDDKDTGKKRVGFFVEAREVYPLEWKDNNVNDNSNQNNQNYNTQSEQGFYQPRQAQPVSLNSGQQRSFKI